MRHLDTSSTKIYKGTVLYGFEHRLNPSQCQLVKVRNGYVIEAPILCPWIRGQHIEVLEQFFKVIKPLHLVVPGY